MRHHKEYNSYKAQCIFCNKKFYYREQYDWHLVFYHLEEQQDLIIKNRFIDPVAYKKMMKAIT